jgi:hypothetical protein
VTDIYDISISDMKIGVAIPIPNNSFRYWDNPGVWSDPTKWTENNLAAGRYWTGYDGDRAGCGIIGASIPDDDTWNLQSTPCRWCNDNDSATDTTITTVYWGYAREIYSSSGGGTPALYFQLGYDSAEAFSSPVWTTLSTTYSTGAEYYYNTGTKIVSGLDVDEPWAAVRLVLRDATVLAARIDSVGVMVDPIGDNGYYELTSVRSVTPPDQAFTRYTQDGETRLGTTNRFDPSGGGEKLRLRLRFEHENITIYENLKTLYDYNHGTPGMAPLPLMIEPNLPGYPPMFMCNIEEKRFPLTRDSNWGDTYGGDLTLVGVWA